MIVGGPDLIAAGRRRWPTRRPDSLKIEGSGAFDYATSQVDYMATIAVDNEPQLHSFDINQYLVDVPFPVRCRGNLYGPDRLCQLDAARVGKTVQAAPRGPADNRARQKIDQVITEKVPAQFRDAARGLLDVLERSKQVL